MKKIEQNLFFAQNKFKDLIYRLFQSEIFFLQFCGGGREESQNNVEENDHEREATRKRKRTIEINIMRERTGSESTREKEKRRKK
jgi:transposase-like protein